MAQTQNRSVASLRKRYAITVSGTKATAAASAQDTIMTQATVHPNTATTQGTSTICFSLQSMRLRITKTTQATTM
jgi:hypothetical protein